MVEYDTDSDDQLRREVVGAWAEDKHKLLAYYVDASRPARAQKGGTPCLIDLYCGPGRVRSRNVSLGHPGRDGSALCAIKSSMHPPRGRASPFARAYVGDTEKENVDACVTRASALGIPVEGFVGPASSTVTEIVGKLPRQGLHLAFLDPYAIDTLPFSVIRELSTIPNVDLLIHFASLDVKRNLSNVAHQRRLEACAPGWSQQNQRHGLRELRRLFFSYWSMLVGGCGYNLSAKPFCVRNNNKAELYLLTVASKHPLGTKIWDSFRIHPQTDLFGHTE